MLNYHMLKEQTFENLIQEARNQIPLYTREWTNFNPSDPAETILENISAFSILQQAYMVKRLITRCLGADGYLRMISML